MIDYVVMTPAGNTQIKALPPANFLSFYVFAMHKSGSVLLNSMLDQVFTVAKVPQVAIPEATFRAGLPENVVLNPEELIFKTGYCYRGYRSFPEYLERFNLSDHKKILLVRDPRDMVVSYFFSAAGSHVLPQNGPARDALLAERVTAKNADIQEYCVNKASMFIREFESYEGILNNENTKVYRYEDVIFKKREWLGDIFSYLDLDVDASLVSRVADRNDVRPEEEKPSEHIRQVTPGNYKKHLTNDTISNLNATFSEMLAKFDYPM